MLEKSARLAAVGAMLAVLAAVTPAEEARPDSLRQTVLLLRNGEVIEGKITRAGDLYYVGLSDGELRIKAAEVELWCEDIEECYRRKRAVIQPGNVYDHLRLARWCLRHKLYGRTAEALADAIDADPKHPMIGLLQQRLKTAMRPPPEVPESAPEAKPPSRPPSVDELDRLIREMPPGTVETFTNTIQPLLMNNCTAAGCHGPRSPAKFRLFRTSPSRPASQRLTQRNLHATLQWVDRRSAAASKLLTEPARPHGTAKTPIFSKYQVAQYRRMVDWVRRVAGQKEPPAVAMKEGGRGKGEGGRGKGEGRGTRDTGEISPPATGPAPLARQEPRAAARPVGPAVSPRPEAPPSRRFVPADPFDPEIFNRRFFGDSD